MDLRKDVAGLTEDIVPCILLFVALFALRRKENAYDVGDRGCKSVKSVGKVCAVDNANR